MLGSQRSPITAATDFFYLRLRHRDAWSSAAAETIDPEQGFQSLSGHKYCLLTTFRKSGDPVPTPVWFGLAEGRVYVSSEAAVGKVKRIRNNPRVRVAPATFRGRPLGPPIEGRARILAASESEPAERAIAANYGLFRKLYEGIGHRLPIDNVYIEVEPLTQAESKE
jgi:PPOX class probable F420-dependent enzyme